MLLGVVALLWLPAVAQAQDGFRLVRVVALMRHGVRAPTKPASAYQDYAAQPWPQWDVAPGMLTANGAANLTELGKALRAHYAQAQLVPAAGCLGEGAFLWADNGDPRTIESGWALAKGLGDVRCPLPTHLAAIGAEEAEDPLFHGIEAGHCQPDADGLDDRLQAQLTAQAASYHAGLEALARVLGQADRDVRAGTNQIAPDGDTIKLTGPLALGSTLAENLYLQAASGFAAKDIGWGRADRPTLNQIMVLHNLYSDVLRRTPQIAGANAAGLAQQILASLGLRDDGTFAGHIAVPTAAKLVVFIGHDTNLANLSGLLQIPWTLNGQPDATGPDTTLAFELWQRRSDGARFVRVVVFYQTLNQLRRTAPLGSHPHAQLLTVPACAGPAPMCQATQFAARLMQALPHRCML